MKNFCKIASSVLSILGCVLGAGFISGAEINTFFTRFGILGLAGILISSICFSAFICRYREDSLIAYKKVNFLPICQVVISGAMFAGCVESINKVIYVNQVIVCVVLFILLFVSLVLGIQFAKGINIIVSLIFVIILPFVLTNIKCLPIELDCNIDWDILPICILYSLMYVSINSIASSSVIADAVKGGSLRQKLIISVVLCIVLVVLLAIVFNMLFCYDIGGSMPIIDLIENSVIKTVYLIIFVIAMLSTLFSTSCGARRLFYRMDNTYLESTCVCCLICSVSFIGLEKIITFGYPTIGTLLLIQIIINYHKKKSAKLLNFSVKTAAKSLK